MAISKTLVVPILISLLVLHLVEAVQKDHASLASGSMPVKIDCGSACIGRCQLASRQGMCQRACGSCCARCNCVPPGTSGNHDACPCYASLTTHGGRSKCP